MKKIGTLFLCIMLSTTVGFAGHAMMAKKVFPERPLLHGMLGLVHFHPLTSQGCESPQDKRLALADAIQKGQLSRQLAALIQPRVAHAVDTTTPCRVMTMLTARNTIVNSGENYIVDAWQGLSTCDGGATACLLSSIRYHGSGTNNTAVAETDTGLNTELTTQYNPDNTRATGSRTEGASTNIFQSVGTNTVDATVTLVEWASFTNATVGSGTMVSRVVHSGVGLVSGDSVQYTWNVTVE